MTKDEVIAKINKCDCIPQILNIVTFNARRRNIGDAFDSYSIQLAAYDRIMELKQLAHSRTTKGVR